MFPSEGVDEWRPSGAAESLEECKQAALTAAENTARKYQSDRGMAVAQKDAVIDVTFSSGERAAIAFVCLPDTLDPRKPK
jgi:hypothetical protein